MNRILIILIAVLLSACDAVYTSHPPGDAAINIDGQEERWQGVWVSPDGFSITVKVIDAPNGVIRIGWIQELPGDLEYKSVDVYLREHEGWTFASIPFREAGSDDLYLWGKITRPGTDSNVAKMVLWVPNARAFARYVKQGTLQGSIDDGSYSTTVVLKPFSNHDLGVITSSSMGELFMVDRPIVFIHLSAEIEKWL